MWLRRGPVLHGGVHIENVLASAHRLQRRLASQPSRNNFRAGTVESMPFQVKPNFSPPAWQPNAKYMKYKPVRWLTENLLPLATYQLVLEVGFTIGFGSLLYTGAATAEGVCTSLQQLHYPFVSWIDTEGGVYTEPIKIGPFVLNPEKLTALHTGHNIANGLFPLQVLLLMSTYPIARGLARRARSLVGGKVAASQAVPPLSSAASAADSASMAKPIQVTAAPVRRASYVRARNAKPPSNSNDIGLFR